MIHCIIEGAGAGCTVSIVYIWYIVYTLCIRPVYIYSVYMIQCMIEAAGCAEQGIGATVYQTRTLHLLSVSLLLCSRAHKPEMEWGLFWRNLLQRKSKNMDEKLFWEWQRFRWSLLRKYVPSWIGENYGSCHEEWKWARVSGKNLKKWPSGGVNCRKNWKTGKN